MTMKKILLPLLLGHLLKAGVGSVCVPVVCLTCNTTNVHCTVCKNTQECQNDTIPSHCRAEFQVFINSTAITASEGDDITLSCIHNLPNVSLTFGWKMNGQIKQDQNKSILVLQQVLSLDSGSYSCVVNSTCGSYESLPVSVNVQNQNVILLVVCGVAALLLILVMGLAMKFKLKRDNDKHRERRKQRVQGGQNDGPAPFTPSVS